MQLTIVQAANCVLLTWGSLFCLVAAWYFGMARNYEARKRRWMIWMQLSTAAMLLSDAAATLSDGASGTAGGWIVRVANFSLFVLTDLTMLMFSHYLCACLLTPEEERSFRRVRAAKAAIWLGVGLVVLTQFTGLYYTIDSANVYHRSAGYWISLMIPVAGMLAGGSLLVQYRKRVSTGQLVAISSYIILPLIGASIQTLHYGWSLISLSVGLSMIEMFLASTREQNAKLRQLETSRAQIAEKLEIATMLNRCVAQLSEGTDMDIALHNLMEVVRDYFGADRSYLFEIPPEKDVLVNTYEAVKEGIAPQIDNLQEVPVEIIGHWMEHFRKEQIYYMEDLEQEKGHESYAMLAEQQVQRLLAVPMCRESRIVGFLGLDNPSRHEQDPTLLSSIQFFITNSLSQRDRQAYLKKIGYYDLLTHLRNRNSYLEDMERWKETKPSWVGAIYIDLNCLKAANDHYGHDAGDALICRMAAVLEHEFPRQAYRIGGDEFAVVLPGIPQEQFELRVQRLRAELQRRNVSAAVGAVWEEYPEDITALMRQADDRMYQEKGEMKRG